MQNKMTRPEFTKILHNYCYHNYKWQLDKLTRYTHREFNKLLNTHDGTYIPSLENRIIAMNKLLIEGMKVNVSLTNLKIVTISIYIFNITLNAILEYMGADVSDYYSNLEVCQRYIDKSSTNDTKCRDTFDIYQFKIVENEGVFTFMDDNYNVIRINDSIAPMNPTDRYQSKRLYIREFVEGILTT